METEHHTANLRELAYAQCACVLSTGKMADLMYGRQREGALDLGRGAVSEKRVVRTQCHTVILINAICTHVVTRVSTAQRANNASTSNAHARMLR